MTIHITPRAFGKVAAEGFRYGFDVSAYLVRRALNELPPPNPATRQPAEESPAVLSALGLPATPAFIPAPPVPGLEPVEGPPDFSALTSAMHR